MLEITSRVMLPLTALVAVWFFLRGHNLPGGGFIGGLVLIVQGIVGVYIGKIYAEARRRPLYVVAETVGLPPPEIRP